MPEVWFPHLGIEIQKLNDIAIQIFGIDIYWYGIIIGMGVLSGLVLAMHEAKRTGQNPETYLDFTLIALVFCIIGARLYYVAFSWPMYQNNLLEIFNLRHGGLAIYGGIIAGLITAIIYTKKKKINFWLFCDTAVPSLLLGQILGRWGNFFNKEAFGGYTDSLFAMRYIKDQVYSGNLTSSVLDHIITINGVDYVQVHPTFLYESGWNLMLLIILMILKRKKKFDGQLMGIYIFGYALGRVWIEGLRTDQLQFGTTGIAVSQVLSGVLLVVGMVLLYMRWQASKKEIQKS